MNALTAWMGSAWGILQQTLGPVEKDFQLWILLAVATLAMGLMLRIMATATGNQNGGVISNAVVMLVGVLVILLAAAAAQKFGIGDTAPDGFARWIPLISAVSALLILVVPFMCLLQRVKYLTGLVSIAISVAVAMMAVVALQAVFRGIHGGERVGDIIEHRMNYEDVQ